MLTSDDMSDEERFEPDYSEKPREYHVENAHDIRAERAEKFVTLEKQNFEEGLKEPAVAESYVDWEARNLRIEALRAAAIICQSLAARAEYVIAISKQFEAYLRGDDNLTQPEGPGA